jgi:thiol-disulfide isomerase/thioredoxin
MPGTKRGFIRRTRFAAVLATLILLSALGSAEAINLGVGQSAPDFTVAGLGGGSISLRDYRGAVTVVMFWSSWCSRCREELVFLEKMQAKYPAARFLAVNCETDRPRGEDIARMKQVIAEWKLTFVTGVDEGLKVWDLYKINALPTSLIIGPDGKVLFIQPSFVLESPEVIDNALQSACAVPGQLSARAAGD